MRRVFASTAVGLVLLITGVAQAAAQAPVGDSVTGDLSDPGDPFINDLGLWVHALDARSGTAGENPTGAISWEIPSVKDIGWFTDVTCLAADGNTAVIGFSGTATFAGFRGPVAGLVRVVDGGGPASGQDSFEWAEVGGPFGDIDSPIPGPTDCSSYPGTYQPHDIGFSRASGDIVVTDTPVRPTAKHQCRNGGWKRFGVFRNRGQCVAFVRRGER
jgi:hypothetical protein